ncbi:MAG: protein translocase subunit SecF [Clostridia bacterium]
MIEKLRKLNISSKWQLWYIIPIVILLIAVVVFITVGLKSDKMINGINIGIDFEGGTQMTVKLGDGALGDNYAKNVKIITDIVEKGRDNAPKITYVQRISEGGTNSIRIKYKNTIDDSDAMFKVNESIYADLYKQYGKNVTVDSDFVTFRSTSATATKGLMKDAILASLIAIALIMVYIIIRFELYSGVSAVLALLHDVIIMIALTIIFQIQINSSYVAAIVTIISYSINNTIVVFDRVRERKRLYDKRSMNYIEIADDAIVMTLTRTMFTSATTVVMVVLLSILGVPSMREFTLPILFGLVAGTFSSMFLAAPTWAAMNNWLIRYRAKKYAQYKAVK